MTLFLNRRFPILLALAAFVAAPAIADEPPATVVDDIAPTDDTDDEIEFRVPDPDDASPLTGDFFEGDQFDLPFSYPSLADQIFEGGGGLLRSNRSRWDEPRAVDIINRQTLDEIGPIDMGQALEQREGVAIQRTGRGQSSPFIRGLTGQQVLILVDGIRLSNATFRAGPNQYFNLVDPNMVDRVEVLRGPGSVQWGSDAIGGVINIVTRRAEFTGDSYLRGSTVQRFHTQDSGYTGRVNAEGWIESAGVFAGAGYGNYNDVDRGGGAGRQPATSFNQYSGDVKLNYTLSETSEMIFAVQHFEQQDVFRTDRHEKGDERIFDPQQRDLAYIRYNNYEGFGLCDSLTITASVNRMKEDQIRHDDNMGAWDEESQRNFENRQTGVNVVATTDMNHAGQLMYGVDWYHEHIDSFRRDIDFSVSPSTDRVRSGPYPDDSWYTRFGAFLEWDVQLTERLGAVTGVRYSYVAAGAEVTVGALTGYIDPTYSDVSASANFRYDVADGVRLVGGIAEGFRAPNLDDFAATNDDTFAGTQIPNPSLRPERSLNYEVGIKIEKPRYRGNLFVFWTDIRDHILRQPVGDPLDPAFILARENRDTYLNGVEYWGEFMLDHHWSAYGNFTYVYGHDEDGNEPLSRVNPTQGIAGLRWRSESGQSWFDSYLWLVAKQDRLSARDLADTVRIPAGGTPGFITLNFRAAHMIDDHQRVAVNFTNVTDELYRVHGSGSDGPGIGATLSYEWLH
jgi:hemoglobin/transferrin/lactoferrin receptor protein